MSYIKQTFVKGQTLKADHMNHIESGIDELSKEKVNLPQENGNTSHGTAGQFAVSDGKGGITWKTLVEAEAVMY